MGKYEDTSIPLKKSATPWKPQELSSFTEAPLAFGYENKNRTY